MSKLKELIDRLCPDGVPFKALDELTHPLKKSTLKISDLIEGGEYPVINSGRDLYGYYNDFNNEAPALTIAARGEYAGWISFFDERFWAGGLCYPYKSKDEDKISTKFLYYWLKNRQRDIMDNLVARGSIPALNKADIDKYKIPVPPIEVQEEIVRILDTFSAHAAELQAELQARKEQYEYYRNLLLTFNPSACGCGTDDKQEISVTTWGGHNYKITWKTMEEVFEFRNGYTPSKSNPSFWEGGTIPWFRMEDIRDFGRILSESYQHITPEAVKGRGLFEKGSFILATTATIGEHAMLIADSLANQRFTNLKVRKSLDNELIANFIYYYLFVVDDFCRNNTNVSGFASVDMGKLKKMPFPVPPLELQEKIVAILDRFETLVNDLTQGLPAEIAAVKERYEYYRNKLLTFKKAS